MKTFPHPTAQSFHDLARNTLGPGLQFSGPSIAVLESMVAGRDRNRFTG